VAQTSGVLTVQAATLANTITIEPSTIPAGVETPVTFTGSGNGDKYDWSDEGADCTAKVPSTPLTSANQVVKVTRSAGTYKLCYTASGKSGSVAQASGVLTVQASPAATPAPPTNGPAAADGSVIVTTCAPIKATMTVITLCDTNGLAPGMQITFGKDRVTIVSIARRLSEEGRRLTGTVTVTPAFQADHNQGTLGTAVATPAPTPVPVRTTACNGAVNPSCVAATEASGTLDLGEQFSCATVGKPEAAMMSICTQFKTICTQPQDAAWLQLRPRCNGVVPQHR